MAESQEPSQPNKKLNHYNSYLKYSGLAIQLLVVIGVFGWFGYKIDQWLELKFPAFLLLLGFTSFGGMMYQIYRSINREQLLKFLISLILASGLLVGMSLLALRLQWVNKMPSFLYVTIFFVFFITLITYRYLLRLEAGASFILWYLFLMVVKLIAYLGYNVFLVLNDRPEAVPNVVFFLLVYFVFTAIEIVFLYRHVNRENQP